MAVTYTITEADGHQHTRTSRGHTAPEYLWAVVRVPHGRKADVSYCSRRDLAEAVLRQALKPLVSNGFTREHYPERVGKPKYPRAALYPVTAS